MNFLSGVIADGAGGQVEIQLDAGPRLKPHITGETVARHGDKATVGVRPEDVRVVAPDKAILTGEVQVAEQLGGETFVYVAVPGGSVTVEIRGQARLKAGEKIGLAFDPAAYHVFASNERVLGRRAVPAEVGSQ